ncbi:hypothetical protein QW131_16905 [Roseibium salinum]|nr:hypothetical protein [Roseibium salinum]
MEAHLQSIERHVKEKNDAALYMKQRFAADQDADLTGLVSAGTGLRGFARLVSAVRVVSRSAASTTFTNPNIGLLRWISLLSGGDSRKATLVGREGGQGRSNPRIAEIDGRLPVEAVLAALGEQGVEHRFFLNV